MTTLRLDTRTMPSAELGSPNPLPPLLGGDELHRNPHGTGLDEEMLEGFAYGGVDSVLPYLAQDGYGRELADREHRIAVLEDERVRAEFLIDLGGRLWSLVDKRTGRELLHRNTAFRPANLALRNAWFAGGVEWNLGTTGHWPLTCEPLHVARVRRADGTESLRMYEYERMRGLVVRIDASIAPDAPLLLVTVTVTNPRAESVPVYWWSNIAVPEAEDVRVVAPAASAYRFHYDGEIGRVPFPLGDGIDRSYTTRSRDAADYFFELNRAPLPWIAALDAAGTGLAHASTDRLRGRKLFVWGTGDGGSHWQRWLTDGDSRYLEIQAGVARTQLEHVPIGAGESWSWTEAYGLVETDAAEAHSDDWPEAVVAVAGAIGGARFKEAIVAESGRDASGDEIAEHLARASGWGALEDRRRESVEQGPLSTESAPFLADDLGEEQEWWLRALDGEATSSDPADAPTSYLVDRAWLPVLAKRRDWRGRLLAGVAQFAAGDRTRAEKSWRASVSAADNAWAWRNLAVLHEAAGDTDEAADDYGRARALAPDSAPLLVEQLEFLLRAGEPAKALEAIEEADEERRSLGRVRFAEARAALDAGDVERCGALLGAGIEVPDLREGDGALDALWLRWKERSLADELGTEVTDGIRARVRDEFPIPAEYDFRMSVD